MAWVLDLQALFLGLLLGKTVSQPFLAPFFFLCNYNGKPDQSSLDTGEVAISVVMTGNPQFYIPHKMYEVHITSSLDFDGFLLTGLYTIKSGSVQLPINTLPSLAVASQKPFGQNFFCSVVHSHRSLRRSKQLSFIWMAPSKGTGCISFLATATLGSQILFKDTEVFQLCEKGASTKSTLRPPLATVQEEGIVMRDDFDSSSSLDPNIWSSDEGVRVSTECGTIQHGRAAVFCDTKSRTRKVVTVPLNMTTASVVQFTLGTGNCSNKLTTDTVVVSYGRQDCSRWTSLEIVSVSSDKGSTIHLLHLPHEARKDGTCLQWYQDVTENSSECWALDNVLVINAAHPVEKLDDNFDPVDPTNWLFFPGARIQRRCRSKGNSLVFDNNDPGYNFATTRDVKLDVGLTIQPADIILEQNFDAHSLQGWEIKEGMIGSECGAIHKGRALVFLGKSKTRKVCTPYLNLTEAGNLRFNFGMGHGGCHVGDGQRPTVFVYAEDTRGHSVMLQRLATQGYKEAKLVSVPIPRKGRMQKSRICWNQKKHGGYKKDIWAVDNIQIVKPIPPVDNMDKFIQFNLNLHCGKSKTNRVELDFSTDHGITWHPLYLPCQGVTCRGLYDAYTSSFTPDKAERWQRVILPLPHAALSSATRFRWRQPSYTGASSWALDSVYIGKCKEGCNGRGTCTRNGCKCDFGYTGDTCREAKRRLPNHIIETLSGHVPPSHNFRLIKGASLNYDCGVIASGKAAVFHKDGLRQLITMDLNATDVKYLQFSVRVGSSSSVGGCAAPDRTSESVHLHYTCNGGIVWNLLREIDTEAYTQPRVVSIMLPPGGRRSVCQFRWWQPIHSGSGRDIWAVDDISLTSHMYNTISLDFSKDSKALQAVDINQGKIDMYCGRLNTLRFTGPHKSGEYRYVMTNSMNVGPSYAIQFDLVMGCSNHFVPKQDNRVYLEFSTDHGMKWDLVRKGCIPPQMCEEYHSPSVFEALQFKKWNRVSFLLPPNTWSGSTRFRLRQSHWTASDSWAVTNLYVGQQCADMCYGHGYCVDAMCKCDKGYHGDSCLPDKPLSDSMRTDFSLTSTLDKHWKDIHGGRIAGPTEGCGNLLSGESMYFYKDGPRELVSRDLNTRKADFLQFYVQVGGKEVLRCYGAQRRESGVLVQYSNNGGITWRLLKELSGKDYSKTKFVHIDFPNDAKTQSTRLRWWQPMHSGSGVDQWAVDEIVVGAYKMLNDFQDDFEAKAVPRQHQFDHWLTVTDAMAAPYCQSQADTLMFANQLNDKVAMTKDLNLKTGDVVQFKINVGCSKTFSYRHPVLFQYSLDAGMSWHLVRVPCYLEDQCQDKYDEGTIYYQGTYGEWTTVIIPLKDNLVNRRVNFRWWQKGGPFSSFALDDVYIGPPCPDMCSGHGVCMDGKCKCEPQHSGDNCSPMQQDPPAMIDRFDDINRPNKLWKKILGGNIAMGCGVISRGGSLYFNGDGTREARTVPLNTAQIKVVQFVIRIGSQTNQVTCVIPKHRNEGVIVEYSNNNGIKWTVLKVLDPFLLSQGPMSINIDLPAEAKTNSTIIRWWQPNMEPGVQRAQWALDNVIIAVNDSSPYGFQENFSLLKNEVWYAVQNAVPRITCNSAGNALEFSKNAGGMRYTETWDYHVTSSTFLQFYIAMGCSGTYSTLYNVDLQYSVDMGHTWHPVVEECLPPKMDCSGYHQSSTYLSESHANWTRVTLYLPAKAVSSATRFRWLQRVVTMRGNVWALDNVYLGDGCPWMCSGHGTCDKGKCVCDPGYVGKFCVPSVKLPMELKDDFNTALNRKVWPEMYGGELTNICGVLDSGRALTFDKKSLRMVVTRDLDVSMALYIQFSFKYGCDHHFFNWPREHMVLLQYSNNGGISWTQLKQIYGTDYNKVKYFNVKLPTPARTNSTRFRFWQPQHDGPMKSVWSLDNVYIGGTVMNPDTVYQTFDLEPHPADWFFWPGGKIGQFCSFRTRSDAVLAGTSAMVFIGGAGEHSITTTDLGVNDMTVIQFDINVGCSSKTSAEHSVRLEYSVDHGKTWQLVIPQCNKDSVPPCEERQVDPSVYYAGTSEYWQRMVVPLTGLQICGVARFRWYQGYFNAKDVAPEWALDNVYIGMQCKGHCHGHGNCFNGLVCQCDDHYKGTYCVSGQHKQKYLKEEFEGKLMDNNKWFINSGGKLTDACGILLEGFSLMFGEDGKRVVSTRDLDLSVARVIQFFIKLGCGRKPLNGAEPVLLQYSTNGGIAWTTIEKFPFSKTSDKPQYVALHLPPKARTNATMIRWYQPTDTGKHAADWAIDQVYIGGDVNGQIVLQDVKPRSREINWVMTPGSVLEDVCGTLDKAMHFAKKYPGFAVTTDVAVSESTYLQFDISLGCEDTGVCYGIDLEYSLDLGVTWHMLRQECMPSNLECSNYQSSSTFHADVYHGWNKVTIFLPYYTRSKGTRFRWIQKNGFKPEYTWALANVYIGDECVCSCAGHGRCSRGICKCEDGWKGTTCSEPKKPLPTVLTDKFKGKALKKNWVRISGAKLSRDCGSLAGGLSLHFTGACTRQLITVDLDLREAMFVQFHFRIGCLSKPKQRDEGVLIDYSTNGGTEWHRMIELYYDQYKKRSYISVELPKGAKKNGVRIRWWQPHHSGKGKSDWAVDSIVVGGATRNPGTVKDSFDKIASSSSWLEQDNIDLTAYCGALSVLRGTAKANDNATLTTIDMHIKEHFILQFSINVGCNSSWDSNIAPVHLMYSTDYGRTWKIVIQECFPFYPECNGKASTPSIYYATKEWKRVTIHLSQDTVSKHTRFRWIQLYDPSLTGTNQQWAIDDVYIGPACPDMCHGHGLCDFPRCICDKGYGGINCHLMSTTNTHLKDTFNDGFVEARKWFQVQGGHVGTGCQVLVEGRGLHFDKKGQRQAVTADLDLRNARFIEYYAMIGGRSTKKGCGSPRSRDYSVVLQYSADSGITWHTLHVLDHSSYWTAPQRDYIPLPRQAHTNATRVRWWQMVQHDDNSLGWTLDDVHIGGFEINPSRLYETFEGVLDETRWGFYPNGRILKGVCGRKSHVMAWGKHGNVQRITTGQLIVQEDYMIQFKIVIGCAVGKAKEAAECDTYSWVLLEYNKDPHYDTWTLVEPQCLQMMNPNSECRLYFYSPGSVYTPASQSNWTRVTMRLPRSVYSSNTRFRWMHPKEGEHSQPWAIDDVYIGEACPDLCNGRGECVNGKCLCDTGYTGANCLPVKTHLITSMTDGFEGGVLPTHWERVTGGAIGLGCGTLLPFGHGKTLYFNGCGLRQAVTAEMDTTLASVVMFVIQIGSLKQVRSCNSNLQMGAMTGHVVLQYTTNKGIDWHLMAEHLPKLYQRPKKVSYKLPLGAKAVGVQFRWWQPLHRGEGYDQWAIDHVEIIRTRNMRKEHLLRTGHRNVQHSPKRSFAGFYPS